MKKRCVPNRDEIEKKDETKKEKIVQTTIETTIKKQKLETVKKVIEPETLEVTDKPEIVEEIEKQIPQRVASRADFTLFTISANIKIGKNRLFVQKIIEEQNERKANIEFDRIIKKELGKPKSITKRTSRFYKDEDEDKVEQIIEEKPKQIEQTPEMIELEEKIKLLSSKYLGYFKINFTKGSGFTNDSHFVFATSIEDAKEELKQAVNIFNDKNNSNISIDFIMKKVKSIVRMTSTNIKTDKVCLKELKDCSVEDIKEMIEDAEQAAKSLDERAKERYEELIQKGYKVFIGKVKTVPQIMFVEFARNKDEADVLVMSEDRTRAAISPRQKTINVGIGEANCINDTIINETVSQEDILIAIKETLEKLCKKQDTAYNLLYGENSGIDSYGDWIDSMMKVYNDIRDGKPKEAIIKEKIEVNNALLRNTFQKEIQKIDLVKSGIDAMRTFVEKKK